MPSTPKPPTLLTSHLSRQRVFAQLSSKSREALAGQFTLASATAGATLLAQGRLPDRLGLILSGSARLSDPDLNLSVQLEAGDLFGFGATPAPQLATWQAVAGSDCELAWLPAEVLVQLCAKHPQLAFFLPSYQAAHQPQEAQTPQVTESSNALNLLSTPIRTLIKRAPITVTPDTSIQATAALMRDLRVSSVLLVEQGLLFGLVTDRDLRNRVVAQGLDISHPVSDIATLAPMTVSANSPAFEALLLMARHNIHHIPVMEGGDILGMITATDLTEQHSTSAVYLAGDIYKQSTVDGLKAISTRIKQLQQHLAAADASAYSTGHIITSITDAITIRLINLAEAQFGPAPIDYVWVAAGSQARNEQTAKSDQDNCLILDDAFDEATHGAYFKALSKFVCDGLAECGYIHCPGDMMAMTDQWRQPRRVWAEYFHVWVDQPKPKALMLTCVFFDLRAIHGKADLLDGLRQQVVQRTKGNSLFLAHMVSNALKHRPPLGMFGQITLSKGGDNPHTIDLKHTGIVPIVDLARIYALAAGVTVANTHDRLEVSSQAGEVSAQSARDLRDALEFLGKLRIAHQARQTRQGKAPDNFLALEELSNFERSHLKNAFSVVQTLQDVLKQRY
ncbi:putative nucleotidyltransferase substrate binding domain-containing protein [Rhodoferax sp.]|uniref:putative nucleotidyltransferase substrate binding domain-containing protein n=1 Tax=Rhodoferax sp. TaxID=50421 RepID=UPI0025CBDECC|nr:putative nucleotidyltransferase substrate binding domain-containing protein [Rhodoferax sp.]